MGALWHQYWAWVGGNIGAMPLQTAITVAVTVVFRRPVARLWHHVVGDRADLDDIRRAADAAHRIAADLFERHGEGPHPLAPPKEQP